MEHRLDCERLVISLLMIRMLNGSVSLRVGAQNDQIPRSVIEGSRALASVTSVDFFEAPLTSRIVINQAPD